ncbi:hypothetical protein AVEN_247715-1 [Araneus ventricosus]|uniref:Uncharacterized protein n=1 Tax=Araneus ventricosus TaxID=182803 RepID=A0A4Y2GPQ1_ARAVE|nr:hypothetical protein AVEN_247715-1 [Araneus ventricosus]
MFSAIDVTWAPVDVVCNSVILCAEAKKCPFCSAVGGCVFQRLARGTFSGNEEFFYCIGFPGNGKLLSFSELPINGHWCLENPVRFSGVPFYGEQDFQIFVFFSKGL